MALREGKVTIRDPGECDCICHKQPGVMHFFPCCQMCATCLKMIRNGYGAEHNKVCDATSITIRPMEKL